MALVALIVAFLVIPLIELWVILEVGARIGIVPTLVFLVLVSVLGGWTVQRVGVGVWRRARTTLAEGRIPGREMLDGSVVLFAGALLLVPGFVTDLVGFVLLIPFVRRVVGVLAARRLGRRIAKGSGEVRTVHVESTWTAEGADDVVEGHLAGPRRELEA